MKRSIFISIESLDNKDLKKIQNVRAAIKTLSDFAIDMKKTATPYKADSLEAIAPAEGEQKAAPAFTYFHMDIDVDGLEEILEKIGKAADQLEEYLQELTRKIYTGLANEKPQE